MTDLRRRLARLEGAGEAVHGPTPALLVLPAGTSAADADALIARHRERTGWNDTLIVLPSNGREPQPPNPAASGHMETDA